MHKELYIDRALTHWKETCWRTRGRQFWSEKNAFKVLCVLLLWLVFGMRMKCACRLKSIENSSAQEISSGDSFHVFFFLFCLHFSLLFTKWSMILSVQNAFLHIEEPNIWTVILITILERAKKKICKPHPMARFRFYFVFLSYKTTKPLPLTWMMVHRSMNGAYGDEIHFCVCFFRSLLCSFNQNPNSKRHSISKELFLRSI